MGNMPLEKPLYVLGSTIELDKLKYHSAADCITTTLIILFLHSKYCMALLLTLDYSETSFISSMLGPVLNSASHGTIAS